MVAQELLDAIAAYTQAVQRGEVDCTLESCPACGRPGPFQSNASRRRTFRVIIDRYARPVDSALTRWKCPSCMTSFTQYPDFALPYKHYVRQDICALSERYLSNDSLSYRQAVQVHTQGVYYATDEPDKVDERRLWPSTLHRWIGFLGGLKNTLAHAWQLIRAKSPTCATFRQIAAVAPAKHRSLERKDLLQRCLRLLRADAQYRQLFRAGIFPYLAMACGFR